MTTHAIECRIAYCPERVTLPLAHGQSVITDAAAGWSFDPENWWRCPSHAAPSRPTEPPATGAKQ